MRAWMKWSFLLAVIVAALGFALWKRRATPTDVAKLPGDETILAHVNGTPVTEYEVEQAIDSTLGDFSKSQLDQNGRRKVLESLVSSRAIAQVQEKTLSPTEAAELDKKVTAYREQLLVNEYLKEHAAPEAVTAEMAKKYYDEHPEKWGGTTTRYYEMILTERAPSDSERSALIAAVKDADSEKDWRKWVDALKKKGHPVAFREGEVAPRALDSRLLALLSPLPLNKASALSFIEGKAYVVRITHESKGVVKPFSEVSGDIRRTLAPNQVRAAVKKASEQVLKEAKVEYR